MPQGFKNSPAHFQRVMDDLFRSVPQSELLVYIDDLLVHSPTIEDNLTGIEKTLELLVSRLGIYPVSNNQRIPRYSLISVLPLLKKSNHLKPSL